MLMRMRMWRGRPRPRNAGAQGMLMVVMMPVIVNMIISIVRVRMFRSSLPHPVLLPWKVFLAVHPNVHLGRGNSAAHDARNLQPRAYTQPRDGFFQNSRRNSGIDECTHEHVTTHAGKTFKVGNAHRIPSLNHGGRAKHRGNPAEELPLCTLWPLW